MEVVSGSVAGVKTLPTFPITGEEIRDLTLFMTEGLFLKILRSEVTDGSALVSLNPTLGSAFLTFLAEVSAPVLL
jgi:hypothetical protein